MSFIHIGHDARDERLELIITRLELLDLKIQIMNAQVQAFVSQATDTLNKINTALNNGVPAQLGADDLAGFKTVQDGLNGVLTRLTATNIVTITSSGTTATVTDVAHGFTPSTVVTIAGVTGPDSVLYNGTFPIILTDPDHFTYVLAAVPSSTTAPGTITATKA